MPNFMLETNPDGSIKQIYKDGQLYNQAIRLERPFDLVNIYFKTARGNLGAMAGTTEPELLRSYGLQSFLMSLTGVEAFTNVFFHVYANEHQRSDVKARSEKKDSLLKRLEDLIQLAFGGQMEDHNLVLGKIKELYQLRNDTVHPRFDPSSVAMLGPIPLVIQDMTVSFQAVVDDSNFCMEAHLWCMLLIVKIAKAAGAQDFSAFCFHWTGAAPGMTEDYLLEKLGLKSDDAS
jgi:hypothetical protein